MTDGILYEAFACRDCEIDADLETPAEFHPNTLDFIAYSAGCESARERYYSIGGGEVLKDGDTASLHPDVYDFRSFREISVYCRKNDLRIWQYVEQREGPEIWDYLSEVWQVMQNAVKEGLEAQGVLQGGIALQSKARYLYRQRHVDESEETKPTV